MLIGLGFMIFGFGLSLAYIGGHIPISWIDPMVVIPFSFIALLIFLFGGLSTLCAGLGLPSEIQPRQPNPEIVVRILRFENDEAIIKGKADDTIHDVLLHEWPLEPNLKKKKWYVRDESGNIVTDFRFSEIDGILTIYFDVDQEIDSEMSDWFAK